MNFANFAVVPRAGTMLLGSSELAGLAGWLAGLGWAGLLGEAQRLSEQQQEIGR